MIPTNVIQIRIAKILRSTGSKKCINKADILEKDSSSNEILNLRNLDLTTATISSIVSCFRVEDSNSVVLSSISFSYNDLVGDEGVINLIENIPISVTELGLVRCGVTDVGGQVILDWLRNASNLRMICIEDNNFSDKLRSEFKEYSTTNPQLALFY